jgi:hypothetical protein
MADKACVAALGLDIRHSYFPSFVLLTILSHLPRLAQERQALLVQKAGAMFVVF